MDGLSTDVDRLSMSGWGLLELALVQTDYPWPRVWVAGNVHLMCWIVLRHDLAKCEIPMGYVVPFVHALFLMFSSIACPSDLSDFPCIDCM